MAVTTGPVPTTQTGPAQAETALVELVVGGMTCAACAARVQAKLNKLTGVTASVNLSTERAYVSAPSTLPVDALIGVVQAAGYTAEVARPAEPGPADPVPGLATAAGRAGRAGRHLGGVAVPRRGAAAGPAPVVVDGHAGVAG